jgi:superfamily II DNA or RNA helicase
MVINKEKLARQQQGVTKWFNSSQFGAIKDRSGTINYFTGVGKSFTAILIIKEYLKRYPDSTIIILVPTETLFQQWNDNLNIHLKDYNKDKIKVLTGATILSNDWYLSVNLLIVDELHMFYGEEYMWLINNVRIKYIDILALTATYEDSKKRHKLISEFLPVIDKIGEKEALEKGFISNFIDYNLAIELTEKEKELYDKVGQIIDKYSVKFGDKNQFGVAIYCLTGGKGTNGIYRKNFVWCQIWAKRQGWYDGCDRMTDDLWNPNKVMYYAKQYIGGVKARKEILYNASNKKDVAIKIIQKFDNCKTIVFGQSTHFADLLDEELNKIQPNISTVFHSNLSSKMLPSPKTGKLIKFGAKRLKDLAIEKIKNNSVRVICTASALDVGFDVEDINLAIITSNTANPNQRQQRKGRATRVNTKSMFPDKEIVIIVNMYVVNSQEEKWLRESQKKNNNIKYWIDSVEELNYNPTNKQVFNVDNII